MPQIFIGSNEQTWLWRAPFPLMPTDRRLARRVSLRSATALAGAALRLHTFGVRITGLRRYGHLIASIDTASWSYAVMFRPPLPGCRHRRCGGCMRRASQWRERLLTTQTTEGA